MVETKRMRYDKNKEVYTFPCGVEINITEDKLRWVYDLFKLTTEFETLMKFSVGDIPIGSARQIKSYLEKD